MRGLGRIQSLGLTIIQADVFGRIGDSSGILVTSARSPGCFLFRIIEKVYFWLVLNGCYKVDLVEFVLNTCITRSPLL